MVWAPRQSGKTFSLVRRFVEIRHRNAMLFAVNNNMARDHDNLLVDLGCPDRRVDAYSLTDGNGEQCRGRRLDYIFIDEIDHYRGDIRDLWTNLVPSGAKIIATSTPTSVRHAVEYPTVFDSIFTYNTYGDGGVDIHKQPNQAVVTINVNDHFEREKELFIV